MKIKGKEKKTIFLTNASILYECVMSQFDRREIFVNEEFFIKQNFLLKALAFTLPLLKGMGTLWTIANEHSKICV